MSFTLRQITEFAAIVSARASLFAESNQQFADTQLQEYWKFCRGRTIDWLKSLDAFNGRIGCASAEEQLHLWPELKTMLNEIFVTEILTRVWGCTITAWDRYRGVSYAEPIARNTTLGHCEVRNKALDLMVNGLQVPVGQLSKVDRLRRKSERWTDLLVGHLALKYQLVDFAFEDSRALDFGQSQLEEFATASDESVWEFVLAGIRLAFSGLPDEPCSSSTWNRGIVNAVYSSFPPGCFDEMGVFKTRHRMRVEKTESASRPAQSEVAHKQRPRPVLFSELNRRFDE